MVGRLVGVRCSSTSEQANEFGMNQMIDSDVCVRVYVWCIYVLQHGADCRTCKSNNVIIAAADAAAVFINAKLLHQNHQIQSISLVCGNFSRTLDQTHTRT